MTLGVCVKGLNAVYFKLPYDLWHEFLPQLLMLVSLIGFMNVLIITKWMTDWSGKES
jgi:V-type H+-transporting ATPase subunit a